MHPCERLYCFNCTIILQNMLVLPVEKGSASADRIVMSSFEDSLLCLGTMILSHPPGRGHLSCAGQVWSCWDLQHLTFLV